MKRTYISRLGAFMTFALFLVGPFPALAQVAPDLGSAAPFAVLGANSSSTLGTVTCTDTGPGIGITGQVGTTFLGGITNIGPCSITGPIVAPVNGAVVNDFNAAFTSIDTLNPACTGAIPIITTTLAPGVYCSAAGTTIPTGVTLTLNGTATDVWIFRVGTGGPGALTVNGGQVIMGGAALACNVFWKTSAAMTVTDSASFVGTVLSGAAATMTRTNWIGRVMATTDVTLTDPEPMTFAGCAAAPPVPPPPSSLACPPVGALTAGGTGVTETVTLASPAPAGGTIVTLTSSAPGTASVPVSVVVPAGATSVSFVITPGLVPGTVTITATTGGGSVICTAVVGPAFFAGTGAGGPTLDPVGLTILVLLLAGAGFLLVNRMRM